MGQDEIVTQYVEKGQAAFADARYSEAAAELQSAYDLSQTVAINHLLVRALVADQQFKMAQGIAFEAATSYYDDKNDAELYLMILIKNQQFLKAYEFIYALPQTMQAKMLAEVATNEQLFAQNQATTLKTIARQFYHLSDVSPYEQQERLQMANQLPLTEYLKGAKFLLVDPFLSVIGRVTIIDQLRRLHIQETVAMNWFDETLSITPSKLLPLEDMAIYQHIQTQLNQLEQSIGPDLISVMSEQNHLMLMMAYPNLTTIITDEEAWVTGMVAEVLGEEQSSEPLTQRNWRAKLTHEMMLFLQ